MLNVVKLKSRLQVAVRVLPAVTCYNLSLLAPLPPSPLKQGEGLFTYWADGYVPKSLISALASSRSLSAASAAAAAESSPFMEKSR
jgi:hypothetical protein